MTREGKSTSVVLTFWEAKGKKVRLLLCVVLSVH